ncbi:MAG: BsuPI-related putative proteinase inhibitor [bacterium]
MAGIGTELTLHKLIYKPGEPIRMEVGASNFGGQPITLHFISGQRYDFIIKDQSGKAVYQWSADKMFTMALGSVKLEGVRKSLTYRETFKGKLAPGRYTLTGKITSRDYPMEASLTILVTLTGKPDDQPAEVIPIK